MEGLIIFIIISILGAVFNNNKNKEQKSMPPFNNQTKKPSRTSHNSETKKEPTAMSLDDFTKQIFEQFSGNSEVEERKLEPEPILEEKRADQVIQPYKSEVEKTEPAKKESRAALNEHRSNRSTDSSDIMKSNDVIKQNEIGNIFVPSSREALVQAIVASEILGPPKARQR